jgi:hypothetical protein
MIFATWFFSLRSHEEREAMVFVNIILWSDINMRALVMALLRGFFAVPIHHYPPKRLVCQETMIALFMSHKARVHENLFGTVSSTTPQLTNLFSHQPEYIQITPNCYHHS